MAAVDLGDFDLIKTEEDLGIMDIERWTCVLPHPSCVFDKQTVQTLGRLGHKLGFLLLQGLETMSSVLKLLAKVATSQVAPASSHSRPGRLG